MTLQKRFPQFNHICVWQLCKIDCLVHFLTTWRQHNEERHQTAPLVERSGITRRRPPPSQSFQSSSADPCAPPVVRSGITTQPFRGKLLWCRRRNCASASYFCSTKKTSNKETRGEWWRCLSNVQLMINNYCFYNFLVIKVLQMTKIKSLSHLQIKTNIFQMKVYFYYCSRGWTSATTNQHLDVFMVCPYWCGFPFF